jgi:hypothetical protein
MKPPQNTSPTGWWIAGLLERHSRDGKTIYWNNYRLVRAVHWREAFHRAVAHGQSDCETGRRAFSGETDFVGITDLLPVYDEFEDGTELWWQEFEDDKSTDASLPLDIFTEAELEAIYETTVAPH